jgi:RNA polymerase sigma-70 factor (ECF subfamily)
MLLTMDAEDETLRTSWSLVARLKNLGDHDSWAEFDELYRPLILGVAVKAGLRKDEAQDVVQETMASMAKHIQDFVAEAGRGSFRAWLLNMARWRIKDQLRKRLPTQSPSDAATSGTARTPTVERVPDAHEVDLEALCDEEWKERLREKALQELQIEVKPEHYQIFHLLTQERKPIEAVARMVGRNRAQIYLIKHRVGSALKKVVRRLEKRLG